MPNDTTPAPIGADALREALWICVEHNALHFGETHNTVVQGRAALASAAQLPADGALNTIAAMFHSGEEIEGPDGLAMMVDMSVWNDALDAFEGIIGDEMEPAKEQA